MLLILLKVFRGLYVLYLIQVSALRSDHEELPLPRSLLGHQLLPTLLYLGSSQGQSFLLFFKEGLLNAISFLKDCKTTL